MSSCFLGCTVFSNVTSQLLKSARFSRFVPLCAVNRRYIYQEVVDAIDEVVPFIWGRYNEVHTAFEDFTGRSFNDNGGGGGGDGGAAASPAPVPAAVATAAPSPAPASFAATAAAVSAASDVQDRNRGQVRVTSV